jgi:hypothetical protein
MSGNAYATVRRGNVLRLPCWEVGGDRSEGQGDVWSKGWISGMMVETMMVSNRRHDG